MTNADAGEQLASASGHLSLGDIVSIVEGSVPQIPVFRTEELAADAAGGSVPRGRAGQQELNLAVTVVYELTS